MKNQNHKKQFDADALLQKESTDRPYTGEGQFRDAYVGVFNEKTSVYKLETEGELLASLEEATGQLKSNVGGYDCIPNSTDVFGSAHFGARFCDTQGTGNHGFPVIVGLSAFGRRKVREWKVAHLVSGGVPQYAAEGIISQKWAMELGADRWLQLQALGQRALSRAVNAHSKRAIISHLGEDWKGQSFPRLQQWATTACKAFYGEVLDLPGDWKGEALRRGVGVSVR